MSQGIMHGDLVCKLNEELLRVREELRKRDVRLKEAERLLSEFQDSFQIEGWHERREAWLKEGK